MEDFLIVIVLILYLFAAASGKVISGIVAISSKIFSRI